MGDVEAFFSERKVVGCLSRIIVLASEKEAQVVLDCSWAQIRPSAEDHILSIVNAGMHRERRGLHDHQRTENDKIA